MSTKEQVHNFIVDYTKEHLYSPSIREICDGVGLSSTSSVYRHLINLELDGKLKCEGVRRITLKGYRLWEDTER